MINSIMWWALQRRAIYLGGLLIILAIFFFPVVYKFLNKTPTCFDGRKNGTELGIDCGGACQKICEFSADNPVILWVRSFELNQGSYNALAMVENPNPNSVAFGAPYSFKLYDSRNVLIYERKGVIDIPAQKRLPIFESGIMTGERIPARTFFEFNQDILWLKSDVSDLKLRTSDKKISNEDTLPRIEVRVENLSLKTAENIELFAIVYDLVDNAIAGSKTFIERIESDSSEIATFTWPRPFATVVGRIEIIPKISPK